MFKVTDSEMELVQDQVDQIRELMAQSLHWKTPDYVGEGIMASCTNIMRALDQAIRYTQTHPPLSEWDELINPQG